MDFDLGGRIRFFRKRADMSQTELEVSANISVGVISRIESNQTNPTKETLLLLADLLELSDQEIDYLMGRSVLPVNENDIEKAKDEASEFLNQRGKLAYLLDDRWRFYQISPTFMRLLNMTDEEQAFVIGKTTAELIVNPDSPVLKRLDKEHLTELLHTYLPFYFSQMSHMDDDPIYRRTVATIEANDEAREIWSKLSYKQHKKYTPFERRIINFDVWGMKFPLYYAMQNLPKNSRFSIVEYTTKNMILDMLPYLV